MKNFPENVYPGHCIIVALHVFENFKNASEALSNVSINNGLVVQNCPALVCSLKVPGSGDAAWACYRMIKNIKEGKLDIENACIWADGWWVGLVGPGTNNFEKNLEKGLRVGRETRSKFIEMAKSWDWS
jgi:hypothetical protein